MKKLILSVMLVSALFAETKKEPIDIFLFNLSQKVDQLEEATNSQSEINTTKRRVDESQNDTIKLLTQQVNSYKTKIETLEATISKLDSRLSNLEKKVK